MLGRRELVLLNLIEVLCLLVCLYATAAGVESGRNVGFTGVTGILEAGNNNNLA